MAEVTIRHELDCDEDTYWDKCVFDEEYNRRLYKDTLHFPGYELLEKNDTPTGVTRKVHVEPPLGSMPAAVKKVVGDKLAWTEDGSFDRATKKYTFKVTPSTMADKIKNGGVLWTEKLGDKRCARLARITIEVKVFMIGSTIEERLIADLRTSYDAAASFTNTFVKEKGF